MKKRGANPLPYLFKKAWHYAMDGRKKMAVYWSMFVIAQTVSLVCYPLTVARIMNIIQAEGITTQNLGTLYKLLGIMMLTAFVFWAFHGPARILERTNAFRMRVNYRAHLLKGVMTLPIAWHTEHHSGDTIDKVDKGAAGLYSFSEDSFEVIYALVQLVVSCSMLFYFSTTAGGIVLGMILLTCWIIMRFDRLLEGQYRDLSRAENRIAESVFDAISNITTVIILRVERLVFETLVRKIRQPYALYCLNNRYNEIKWFVMSMCCNAMIVLVLGVYFYQHRGAAGGILIGNVFVLIQYVDKVRDLFVKFAGMYGSLLQWKAKVMNAEELAEDFRAENFTNHVLPAHWQRLDIEGLTFSYHSGVDADLHLDDVSLSLEHGKKYGLVGKSGSGKTTFLKLARGLHPTDRLKLSVDGQEIPTGFDGISRAISLVPQDPEIFATTILENITIGAEYDRSFVRRFSDMAEFTEVAESLPRGFDSSIKERGVNLSGGQQQKLALARGFLACHDKDIVLLDEPTSSLDTGNEMRVYQNVFREFRGKTIVSSIHRLHLLPLFDHIYFFDSGRIIASGTLNDLLASCPPFQELWRHYQEGLDHNAPA